MLGREGNWLWGMRSNTKRERSSTGPSWRGLHLFTFHVTLNSATSSLHPLENVQIENESLPEVEESKVQRNEITCLWFHSQWVVTLLIASPRFFPCCLPLQIRCQKNLGLKIHWLIPVPGRDCVCFMETGSVSFSIATVRVRPEEQLWGEATFFHSFDRKYEELGLIHESNSGFFWIRGVCRQRTQRKSD